MIAIGMVLALVTLRIGFLLDDYAFIAWLDGTIPRHVTPFNLYEFATGDRTAAYDMVRSGPWPWWTNLDLKVRFFRPLASAILTFDHALFGRAPLGYHLHSLVWYFLLLAGVGLLLRCVLSPRVFALAFLMFVLAGGHAEAVGWISARHMLVGAAPAVWGLVAHVYYRERGFSAGRFLAPVGMLLGLAGSEAAIGALFFWIAYELVGQGDGRTLRAKLPGAAAPLAIAGAYFIAYKIGGFGAAHNDAYFEPLSDPLRFIGAAMWRLPLLLGEMTGGTSSAFAVAFGAPPFVAAGVVALFAFAFVLRTVWPYVGKKERRALPWLGAGAVLATTVSLGGFPGGRLLLIAGIGGFAFVATVVLAIGEKLAETSLGSGARWGLRFARGFLVFAHLGLSPLMFLGGTDMLGRMGGSWDVDRGLDPILGDSEPIDGKPRHVFILAASDPAAGMYAGAVRAVRAPKTAVGWVILSMARGTHHVKRTGPRTLVITAEPGLLYGAFEVVFRSLSEPLKVGDQVELDDAIVKVLSTDGPHPTSFEFELRNTTLDDPSFVFLMWRDGKLEPVRLAAGEHIDVPWSAGP
ncbi:MAG: hypothetical protein ABW133_21090, partial [Polyangiaceae bacterium]